MADLTTRFLGFLGTIPFAESIDDLGLPEVDGVKRADYLLERRRVVVEVKSLTDDPAERVESILDPYRKHPDFPLFYGEMDVQKVIKHLPETVRKEINLKLFLNLTRTVERAVKDAEKQIHDSRMSLDVPDALGGAVILNEAVQVFSPEVVGARVHSTMNRGRKDGEKVPMLDFVWVIFEGHAYRLGEQLASPSVWHFGPRSKTRPRFSRLVNRLSTGWAHFSGKMHVVGQMKNLGPSGAIDNARHVDATQLSAQQAWENEYLRAPHLRSLSDAEFLDYASALLEKYGRAELSGASLTGTEYLRELTCFFVEARHRGIDFKNIPRPDLGLRPGRPAV